MRHNRKHNEKVSIQKQQNEYELKSENLGVLIRDIRLNNSLTQDQLGKIIGVQKAHISKIENNTKDFRFSTFFKIINALKTDIKLTVKVNN